MFGFHQAVKGLTVFWFTENPFKGMQQAPKPITRRPRIRVKNIWNFNIIALNRVKP
jgi:hypothetical protein